MGPIDFLKIIYNAEYVITDSFHGTAFSINFNKNFYSICKKNGRSEYRKEELLTDLDLKSRILYDLYPNIKLENIDNYEYVNKCLMNKREESINYLKYSMLGIQ